MTTSEAVLVGERGNKVRLLVKSSTLATLALLGLLMELTIIPKLRLDAFGAAVPLRITYVLAISVGLLACIRYRPILHLAIPLFVVIGSVLIGSAIGAAIFDIYLGIHQWQVLFMLTLLPGSIGLGYLVSKSMLPVGFLLLCLLIAFVLTVALTYVPSMSSSLIKLYGISDRVVGQYLLWRSPGIWNGVNSSAGAVNMMVLILMVAMMRRHAKNIMNRHIMVIVAFLLAALHHTIIASKAGLLLLAMLIAYYYKHILKMTLGVISVTAVLGLSIIIVMPHLDQLPGRIGQLQYLLRSIEALGQGTDAEGIHSRSELALMSLERMAISPVLGSGIGQKHGHHPLDVIWYHNDWLIILVGGGALGMAGLLLFVSMVTRIDPVLMLPFLIPAMTNSLLMNPSAICLFGITVGYLVGNQRHTSIGTRWTRHPGDCTLQITTTPYQERQSHW